MPQTCSLCRSEAADDTLACPTCGRVFDVEPRASQGAPTGATSEPPAAVPTTPPFRLDVSRWSLADRIAGSATIVLFVSLFLPWFSLNTSIGIASWTGVGAHWYLYLVMIVCIITVAYFVLRAGFEDLPITDELPHVGVMMAATIFNLVLVALGFIFKPTVYDRSGIGWSFFAFVAVIAAIVAAAPYVVPQLRERTGAVQ